MNAIKKILAPTDLSNLSAVGLRRAIELAEAAGAEVIVYHVVDKTELLRYGDELQARRLAGQPFVPPDLLLKQHEIALTRFLALHFPDLPPSIKIREKVEVGAAARNIVEEAKNAGVDLIVISTHGRTGLSHMLVGSVTEKVVRTASCPVLSIHPEPEEKEKKAVAAA